MPEYPQGGYALCTPAIRRAIEILAGRRSHEHLPGYLALLRARLSQRVAGFRQIEEFHNDYLRVPDAPPASPYLRPFLSRGYQHTPLLGSGLPQTQALLLNRNLQGSYARSSIRQGGPFSRVVRIEEHSSTGSPSEVEYVLVDGHENVLLSQMLSGNKIPAVSLAVFLFRDRWIRLAEPRIRDLVPALRQFLCLETTNQDGDHIYEALFDEHDLERYADADLLQFAPERPLSADDGDTDIVSAEKVREVTLSDLQLEESLHSVAAPRPIDASALDDSDPVLADVQAAREMGYAGVILAGSPGTGKSWYAQQVALAVAGRWDNVRSVQFHPSYQYEDFMFGYVPGQTGRFELRPKEFVQLCRDAGAHPDDMFVMVIDEISRCDVVRVFGEALTYLEMDKRDQPFLLACGEELTVPRNLFLIGTMNTHDKGVDEIDVALERRFAHVALAPDAGALRRLLESRVAKADTAYLNRLMGFFEALQQEPVPEAHLGHAYFLRCTNVNSAKHEWSFRLRPALERAFQFDRTPIERIESQWANVVGASDESSVAAGPTDAEIGSAD